MNGKTTGIEAIGDGDMAYTHSLDYSFIQLPTPIVEDRQGFQEDFGNESEGNYNQGLLKAEEDMKHLIKFTEGCMDMESSTSDFGTPCLSSESRKRSGK